MSRNILKEIVLELRYERQNECGCWKGVLGRENSVCKALRWYTSQGANGRRGGGGRRLLLKVQVRIAGRLE